MAVTQASCNKAQFPSLCWNWFCLFGLFFFSSFFFFSPSFFFLSWRKKSLFSKSNLQPLHVALLAGILSQLYVWGTWFSSAYMQRVGGYCVSAFACRKSATPPHSSLCTSIITFCMSECPCSHKRFPTRPFSSLTSILWLLCIFPSTTDSPVIQGFTTHLFVPIQHTGRSLYSYFSSPVSSTSITLFLWGSFWGSGHFWKLALLLYIKYTINSAFSFATGWVLD